jgi:ketosteroid isomerase-like protein
MTGRMAIESLIKDAYEARHRGDLDALMGYFHPDCRYRFAGAVAPDAMFTQPVGRAAVRTQMQGLIAAFVFSNVEWLSLVVEADKAALYWRADVFCAPSGRSGSFEIMDLFEIADGKIASLVQFTDTAGVAMLTGA